MPYHIEQNGRQWCVIKTATGEKVACHDSEEKAQRQIRAINVSEAEQRTQEKQSS